MGVNLWGAGPLYVNPVDVLNILTKILAEGQVLRSRYRGGRNRGGPSRGSLRQSYDPTNPAESGTCKAQSPGKLAQHNEAQDSGDCILKIKEASLPLTLIKVSG